MKTGKAYVPEFGSAAAEQLLKHFGEEAPKWVVVLGSGLGSAFDKSLLSEKTRTFTELGLPGSTVAGHSGKVTVGNISDTKVAIMAGRVHLYEGYSAQEVVRGVRAMALWGVENFVITNAAGAITNPNEVPRLMIISDQINLTGANPLTGENYESFGPRFPDMSEIYSKKLVEHMISSARMQAQIHLETGVYASLPGPAYETPAEVRMLRTLGADAVGMSTVNETIALRHMGVKNIIGISILCNAGAGLSQNPLSHEEVTKAANQKKDDLARAIISTITTPMKEK